MFSRVEISKASMVGRKKVDKDIERGRLDVCDLASIAGYVVMGRMGAGGLGGITGMSPEPALHEGLQVGAGINRYDGGHKRVESGGEGSKNGEIDDLRASAIPISGSICTAEFSDLEAEIMLMMIKRGKTRGQAKLQIRKMREMVCAERICEEHMEELGL